VKKGEQTKGRGRLLEAWEAPPKAGEAIGCFATTFTFDAPFFEEECLSRFLGMETDPKEHGAAYLIEREDQLAQVYAGVIVDRRYASLDKRSLRWDVIPVRVRGVMHAKITLLMWGNCVRLIIGSANLTKDAYRNNLEVYGVIDFWNTGGASRDELYKTITFLNDVLVSVVDGPALKRAIDFLKRAQKRAQSWKNYSQKRSKIQALVLFGGKLVGKRLSVITSLREEVWNDQGPPRWACVVSPFYDLDSDSAGLALRDILAQRGDRNITWDVKCLKEADGRLKISAPKWLSTFLPDMSFRSLHLEEEGEIRPLHAKCLWLENEKKIVYMVGSSNFTAAGLGVGNGPWNIEANIAYLAAADSRASKALDLAYPASDGEITNLKNVVWEPAMDHDGEQGLKDVSVLPAGFVDVIVTTKGSEGMIILKLTGPLPEQWWIYNDKNEIMFYRALWISQKTPATIELAWHSPHLPSALLVKWQNKQDIAREAFWAVNVESPGSLPLSDELRNLSLDTLLDILTISRPRYEAVLKAKTQNQTKRAASDQNPEIDPHKRVRSETFLIQRTKRVARALEQLRINLERPVITCEALEWRLRGPVGPIALVKSLQREQRPPGETSFLLAEIALTLSRVSTSKTPGALPVREVNREIKDIIKGIKLTAKDYLKKSPKDIGRYVTSAFKEALR